MLLCFSLFVKSSCMSTWSYYFGSHLHHVFVAWALTDVRLLQLFLVGSSACWIDVRCLFCFVFLHVCSCPSLCSVVLHFLLSCIFYLFFHNELRFQRFKWCKRRDAIKEVLCCSLCYDTSSVIQCDTLRPTCSTMCFERYVLHVQTMMCNDTSRVFCNINSNVFCNVLRYDYNVTYVWIVTGVIDIGRYECCLLYDLCTSAVAWAEHAIRRYKWFLRCVRHGVVYALMNVFEEFFGMVARFILCKTSAVSTMIVLCINPSFCWFFAAMLDPRLWACAFFECCVHYVMIRSNATCYVTVMWLYSLVRVLRPPRYDQIECYVLRSSDVIVLFGTSVVFSTLWSNGMLRVTLQWCDCTLGLFHATTSVVFYSTSVVKILRYECSCSISTRAVFYVTRMCSMHCVRCDDEQVLPV